MSSEHTSSDQQATKLMAHPASVATARRFVRDVLAGWGCEELTEVAELLSSELVTNGVLHTGSDLDLVMERRGEIIRVAVEDADSDHLPMLRSPAGLEEDGRGLSLVRAMASRWGMECHHAGKQVWFETGPEAKVKDGGASFGTAVSWWPLVA